jgi:hypothetical protein
MGDLVLGEREDEGGFESSRLSQLSKRSRHVSLTLVSRRSISFFTSVKTDPVLTATERRLKPSLVFDQGIEDREEGGVGGGTWWILKTLARQSK